MWFWQGSLQHKTLLKSKLSGCGSRPLSVPRCKELTEDQHAILKLQSSECLKSHKESREDYLWGDPRSSRNQLPWLKFLCVISSGRSYVSTSIQQKLTAKLRVILTIPDYYQGPQAMTTIYVSMIQGVFAGLMLNEIRKYHCYCLLLLVISSCIICVIQWVNCSLMWHSDNIRICRCLCCYFKKA